jgi:hypothetical protein
MFKNYYPGQKFQVWAPVNAKRELLPFYLYDRCWDHSLSQEENKASRVKVAELTDGETVEVVSYNDGAVIVTLQNETQGYLG